MEQFDLQAFVFEKFLEGYFVDHGLRNQYVAFIMHSMAVLYGTRRGTSLSGVN